MKNKTITILLTACINPDGMSYTTLQDPLRRKEQYIQALSFYLEKTDCKIVFVENTNTDLSNLFRSYIEEGRLEYYTFNGNNYPKHLGKGYGEGKILAYAMLHSAFIRKSDYIVKITGRLVITNISSIINSRVLKCNNNILRFDYHSVNTVSTVCFVCTPEWLSNYIISYIDRLDDSKGVIIESLFYKQIKSTQLPIHLFPFTVPPQIDGISGTTSEKYVVKSTLCNIADNTYFLSTVLNEREKKAGSICLYYLFRILKVICKIRLAICRE